MFIFSFIKGLFTFTTQSVVSVIRFIILGILSGLATAFFVDSLTASGLGTLNLVIIVFVLGFMGVFVPLFTELALAARRKEKRKQKKAQESIKHQKE